MSIKSFLRSFAAGIIAPELFGRLDLAKFQTGLAKCLNFWVLPHGPVQNRPGFQFVREVRFGDNKVKLLPFTYSTDQTMIVEMGASYFRFHTNGGTLFGGDVVTNGAFATDAAGWTLSSGAFWAGSYEGSAGLPGVGGKIAQSITVTSSLSYRVTVLFEGSSDILVLVTDGMVPVAPAVTMTGGYGILDFVAPSPALTLEISALSAGVAYVKEVSVTSTTPYTIGNSYTEADVFDIHYVQSSDVMTQVHPNYRPMELRRLGAASWSHNPAVFTPSISAPASSAGTPAPVTHLYKVAIVRNSYVDGVPVVEETLPSPVASGSNDLTIVGSYNLLSWASAIMATGYAVYKLIDGAYYYLGMAAGASFIDDSSKTVNKSRTPVTSGSSGLTSVTVSVIASGGAVTAVPTGTGSVTYSYVVTSISDTEESYPTNAASCTNNLATAGNVNTIEWAAVAGISRHNIYKLSNGLYGYIGQASGTSFVDNNITPDISVTPPQEAAPFEAAGDYPGAVGYFDQRRCFAGTDNRPQNFWATRSATESNLSYSIPTRDDDAIAMRVGSRENNRIRHIINLDVLLLLTSGGEWKIAPQNSDVLTPTTAAPKQISAEGAANVQPVVTSKSVLYVQESAERIFEMRYQWEAQDFTPRDLSIMAPHLFEGYEIVDMAYAKTPNKTIWAVRSDGVLLGLTYLPEHEVAGWHEHRTTNGAFESVAVVKEGNEHVVYVVVRREIDGTTKRYIERMHTRRVTTQASAFFVDCGLTYEGDPATTITGLDHLEGEEVAILADGAEHPRQYVVGGQITLEAPASVVHVGLPITADAETLPLSLEMQAFGQGVQKNVNNLALRVNESAGVLIGPTFDAADMVSTEVRTTEPYDSPPALVTGVVDVTTACVWEDDAKVCIRHTSPKPVTILSMVADVTVGG